MKNPDRAAAKKYADEHGYFWLPCPRCGEYFGGHEWGPEEVACLLSEGSAHGACCPDRGNDADACRRAHESIGDWPNGLTIGDAIARAKQ
jgi:hypothetical protein